MNLDNEVINKIEEETKTKDQLPVSQNEISYLSKLQSSLIYEPDNMDKNDEENRSKDKHDVILKQKSSNKSDKKEIG